jgi:hypothetical protein
VVFGAYRVNSMRTDLETEALDQLKAFLAAEYAGNDIAALSEAFDSDPRLDPEHAQERAERILATQNITFPSVSARGLWNAKDGGEAVVRVDIQVDGGPPPDGSLPATTECATGRYQAGPWAAGRPPGGTDSSFFDNGMRRLSLRIRLMRDPERPPTSPGEMLLDELLRPAGPFETSPESWMGLQTGSLSISWHRRQAQHNAG